MLTWDLLIEKLVYGGEGLSRVDGEVVFTPFVLPGETVEVTRSGARNKVQRATLVRVEKPSPDRVPAPCPQYQVCGGCQYQHAAYEAQLRFKRDILAETLRRVGRIEFDTARIETIAAEPYGYRNRVQFHVEKGRIGYRMMQSNKLAAAEVCPIASPRLNEILTTLNRLVRDRAWPEFVSSLEVFTDEKDVQWNVMETGRPVARRFFDWLAQEVQGSVGGPLDYAVGDDRFRVSGGAFFQVNRFLLPQLADAALDGVTGGSAWDLYSGVGLFSLPMARKFRQVLAVESGRSALSDLAFNADRASLSVMRSEQQVEQFLLEATEAPDFVLADPPRAGLGSKATARLSELRPKRLVIVACDPATLARDLAALKEAFELQKLVLVDLFPQTYHVEAIATLAAR
jgi:23S rRNA (uracil1939-C5)-methyltransferase